MERVKYFEANPDSENSPLSTLLDCGPESLVRTTPPYILEPDFISQKGSVFLSEFRESFLAGDAQVCHVNARQVMELALTQVKHSKDYYGCWAGGLTHGFYKNIVGEMVGMDQKTPSWFWETPNASEMIFRKIRPMQREVFIPFELGRLQEVGVITVGEDNKAVLGTISIPYEKDEKVWWKKLSPDELAGFVGREEYLDAFRSMLRQVKSDGNDDSGTPDLFGNEVDISKMTRLYGQSDANIWWGFATNANNIVSLYAKNYNELSSGPDLPDRIYTVLQDQGFSTLLENHVRSPKFLTGYYITRERVSPEAFASVLHVDQHNWANFNYYQGKGKRFSGL